MAATLVPRCSHMGVARVSASPNCMSWRCTAISRSDALRRAICLGFAPGAAVTLQQLVRRGRSPGAGAVEVERATLAAVPPPPDRVDDLPGPLHLVVASEERGVADHAVEEQRLIGIRRVD